MAFRRIISLILVTVIAMVTAHPAGALLYTERYEYEAGTWIHLGIELDGVFVEDLKFDAPAKFRGILTRHDKPNRVTIVVRNNSNRRVDAGVALALFDADGRLLASGNTGLTPGVLQAGERHEFKIQLSGVFREIEKTDYFYLSFEF